MVSRKSKKNKQRKTKKKRRLSSLQKKTSIKLGLMGWSGFQQQIIFLPQYSDPSDPRNLGNPAGLQGQYKVVFTFNKPGFSLLPENRHSLAEKLRGDSHLAITKPAYSNPNNPDVNRIRLYAETPDGKFVLIGYPNNRGFLGKMEVEPFYAHDFNDAGLKAYRAQASGLSNISLYFDTPIHIYQMDITEMRTKSVRMSLLAAYTGIPLCKIPTEVMTEEFRRYASLYREALNSNSPNYQFLCYYKIIEGIRKRQKRLIVEAKAKGKTISSRPRQIIPKEAKEQIKWLNSIFPVPRNWDKMALDSIFFQESLDRKVYNIIDKRLNPIRLKIAHAVLKGGEPAILVDEKTDINLVSKWLPICKCIARLLIKTEFPDVFNN